MQSARRRSLVRRVISMAGFLVVALVTSPALAQKADRPAVKVGDRWTYEVLMGSAKLPNRARVISSVTPTNIEGKENGERFVLTRDLNDIETPGKKHSNLKLLSFPLEVGKKWSFIDDFATPAEGRMTCSVVVVGYEKVRVPAGEFDAFKLEAKGDWVVGQEHNFHGHTAWTYWYAPTVRAVVKSEYRHGSDPSTIDEMTEFHLQH